MRRLRTCLRTRARRPRHADSVAAVVGAGIAVLLLLALPKDGVAQPSVEVSQPAPVASRPWTLGPRIGIGIGQTRDEVLGPLAYRGPQVALGVPFAHEVADVRHEARLELLPAHKRDRFGYRGIFFTQRLEYRYLRSFAPQGAWVFGIGAGVGVDLDPALYADASTDYPYWQTVYDLRATGRLVLDLGRRRALELDTAVSVLGMGSRPPVERFDVGEFRFGDLYTESHVDFRFLSFHDHFYGELRTCLRHHGRGAGSQALCCETGFRWLRDPLPILTLDNRLDYTFFF